MRLDEGLPGAGSCENGSLLNGSGSNGLVGIVSFDTDDERWRPLMVRPFSIWNIAIGEPRQKKLSQSKSSLRSFCSPIVLVESFVDALRRLFFSFASLCLHKISNKIALPNEWPQRLTFPVKPVRLWKR